MPLSDALEIGLIAFLIHLVVFTVASLAFHISVSDYSDKGDGLSFKHMAQAMLGDRGAIDEYDSRVLPGYPAMIAMVRLVTPFSFGAAGLLVTFLSAGAAAALASLYFDSRKIGWAVALLPPHAWINMSLAMSEAPAVALMLWGLLLAKRNRLFGAGVVLGLAVLTRPVAIFAAGALFIESLNRGRRWIPLIVGGVAMGLFGLMLMHRVSGGLMHSVNLYANSPRIYAGKPFTWPFHTILATIFSGHRSIWRCVYILAHVALAIGGCLLLARQKSRTDLLPLIWLSGNTLFVLCLGTGPVIWGFDHVPRFMLPAFPPLVWAYRKFLPSKGAAWVYIPLSIAFFVMAIYGVRDCP